MKRPARYVAKAIPSVGWRVWDRLRGVWWGNIFPAHPADLLAELNKDRSSPQVVALARASRPAKEAAPTKKPKKSREPLMRK